MRLGRAERASRPTGWARPLQLPRPLRGDVVLALGLCVVKVGFVVTGAFESGGVTPLALIAAVALTLPLAWRRTAPLTVAVVIASVLAADDLLAGWDAAVLSFDASIIASYSAGAVATQRRAAVALAVLAIGNLIDAVVAPGVLAGNVALALVVFTGVPWLVGQALRRERDRTRRIRVLADELALERERRARDAVAAERVRLARELHDAVGHAISIIAVQADAAAKVLPVDPARAAEPLSDIQTTARQALDEMRRLVGLLRVPHEATSEPQPGLADLEALVTEARATGLAVTYHRDEDLDVAPSLALAAYRIVQEGLTNVRKHADCAEAHVTVTRCGPRLIIEVRDHGTGTTPHRRATPSATHAAQGAGTRAGNPGGFGLLGIAERVHLLGGTLSTGNAGDGPGFLLRAQLPLRAETT